MKIKTEVKAGDHCWNAAAALVNDWSNGYKQKAFCDCCSKDPDCLSGQPFSGK